MPVKILNIDCMEYMKTLEDNAFDLAIVDPPYGIGESGKRSGTRATKKTSKRNSLGTAIKSTPMLNKDWDDKPPSIDYFIELKRVSKNQIIWGANHFIHLVPNQGSPCWIVWDKDNHDSAFADCELAYTSFKTAVRKYKFRWAGMLQGDMKRKEIRIHPTQKPVQLYKWLLATYAKEGNKILDTHLGSGSSAIAAHYSDLDFVGCELDQDYYSAACERFDQETKQKTLFK